MHTKETFVIVSIIILLAIFGALLFLKKTRKPKKISILAKISFAFIFIGILLDEFYPYNYVPFAIGIIIAVIDIILYKRGKPNARKNIQKTK